MNRRSALGIALVPLLDMVSPAQAASAPKEMWPVMLTPFLPDQSIDWKALDAITDWYIENGANGLFACCQSSEVWDLTEEERLRVVERVVQRAGNVPVVAGGLPGFEVKPVSKFVRKLVDLGVQATVLTTSQVVEKADADSLWRSRVEAILSATGDTPFGLYEAPSPYKRLLSAEMMGWAGKTGRFVFHKDTSCEINEIAAKCAAIQGTPFRLFNAHVPILVDAILKDAAGFSGIAANAYPNIVAHATHHALSASRSGRAQHFLAENEKTLSFRYPLSAKVLAAMAGVPIHPVCRKRVPDLNDEQVDRLRALRTAADALSLG